MIKVGYYCSAGYTETGGMQTFLERINPNISFIRQFPIANKKDLKKGRMSSTPIRSQSGITGNGLTDEMKSRLSKYGSQEFDYILLIDDADCRLKKDGAPSFIQWCSTLQKEISEILKKPIIFEVLLASPEIEAWLLSDWDNTFAVEYRDISAHIQYNISKSDIIEFLNSDNIEEYGGEYLNGSCSIKISKKIQEIVSRESSGNKSYFYSKRLHGVSMLNRLDPKRVEEKCRQYLGL